MTLNPLLERVLRASEGVDLLDFLVDKLSPTDLQSLLLEVYHRRATQITPATLLANYERNPFVRPSSIDPLVLLEVERLALSVATPQFEPLELAPVCPLGTNSVVASVHQDKTIATIRNTELVSDSTNVLALECAVRRRTYLRQPDQRHRRVRLCASHRLLRPHPISGPVSFAHFRLFGMCTAGRDEGAFQFELDSLAEQLALYLQLFAALPATGYSIKQVRVGITDLTDGMHEEAVRRDVLAPVAAQFPHVQLDMDPHRSSARNYYHGLCFAIYATNQEGVEYFLVDGGFTTWTQQLLSNQKERLLISGIGTERLCAVFRTDKSSTNV